MIVLAQYCQSITNAQNTKDTILPVANHLPSGSLEQKPHTWQLDNDIAKYQKGDQNGRVSATISIFWIKNIQQDSCESFSGSSLKESWEMLNRPVTTTSLTRKKVFVVRKICLCFPREHYSRLYLFIHLFNALK